MTTTIAFYDDGSGRVLGHVEADGDTLRGDGLGQQLVAQWLHAGRPVTGFVDRYQDWSNGYVRSAVETPVTKSARTPMLSSTPHLLGTHGLWGDPDAKLPDYIENIAAALMGDGHDRSEAIQLAIASVKRWAAGGDHVTPEVQAAAAKAVAEWEELKATHNKTKE